MVLKLYGVAISPNTKRVAATLIEKKVPFEFVPVALFDGETKTPAYLVNHPFGQVPYIDDNGYILYESRAISRYIAQKFAGQGTELAPPANADLKTVALFNQGIDIEMCHWEGPAWVFTMEAIFGPIFGNAVDQAVVDKAVEDLKKQLDVYEVILGKQKYIAGDKYTLADLFHVTLGELLIQGGKDILTTRGPNVKRWWKDISSRPVWAQLKDGVASTTQTSKPASSTEKSAPSEKTADTPVPKKKFSAIFSRIRRAISTK